VSADVSTKYFMTVPVPGTDGREEASIFLPIRYEQLARAAAKMYRTGIVEVVTHPASRRGPGGPFDSPLSEHAIVVDAVSQADSVPGDDGESVPASWHKLGGVPYIVNVEPAIAKAIERAFADGYCHYLQLDFPGGQGDALVSGDWPFGDGMFHAFTRAPFMESEWLFFWEF
jgi:hypothetical protein